MEANYKTICKLSTSLFVSRETFEKLLWRWREIRGAVRAFGSVFSGQFAAIGAADMCFGVGRFVLCSDEFDESINSAICAYDKEGHRNPKYSDDQSKNDDDNAESGDGFHIVLPWLLADVCYE